MSYVISGALQTAIFDALINDATLSTLIGSNIFDALPTGALPETYVSLGRERVQDASDKLVNGTLHQLEISVITTQPGFSGAKDVATAISDRLHDADLTLSRGSLIFLRFERAVARRIEGNSGREIVLRFRARVEDAVQ